MNEALVFEPVQSESQEDRLFPRVAGSIVGAAAADALGWITEFVRGPEHLRKLYGTDRVTEYRTWQKTTGGRFNAYIDVISEGEYSDDTQLALAVGRSLLADGNTDELHFSKEELPLWLGYGRGGGATINRAARAISRKSATWNRNFYESKSEFGSYRNAGANGAAMRVGPIALANLGRSSVAYRSAWRNTIITHGHPRAIWGSVILTEAIRQAALGRDQKEIVEGLTEFVSQAALPDDDPALSKWLTEWDREANFLAEWERTRSEVLSGLNIVRTVNAPASIPRVYKELGCFDRATKGSGTATVLAALAVFKTMGGDYRRAIEATINLLGSDTDTIGGFVGSLSGAMLGYEAIPPEWTGQLQDYDYLIRLSTEVSRIAAGVGIGGKALLPARGVRQHDLPDLLALLRAKRVSRGDHVYHPLFGAGFVESVDAQRLRRKDEAQVVFAFVRFDIGQSCKFRFMDFPSKRKPTSAGPPDDPGGRASQSRLGL